MKHLQRCMSVFALILIFGLSACGGPAATPDQNTQGAASASAAPETGVTSGEQAPSAAAGAGTDTSASADAGAASPAAEASAAAEASPTPAPTTGRTTNYDSAAQQFTFWVMPNGPQPLENAVRQAEAFTQQNPDIGINVELIDWSVAYNQIQTALQGGADACLTQLGTTWVSGFQPLGGLRPFTAEEIASVGGAEAFVPASWATTHQTGSEEIVAIPWFVDSRALAYRKDILQQVGLTPEEAFKDLNAFQATLQKVKDANLNVAPFAHTGRGDWNVVQNASMFIWNYGGDILTQDNKQAAFNSDQAVDAVTFAASFYGQGLTPPDAPEVNTVQAENRMAEGEVFSVVTGPWMVGNTTTSFEEGGWENREVAQNVAFAEFPAGPGGQFSFVGGSQLGIFNECHNPEAAMKFIQYLTSPEAQIAYTKVAGFLPAKLQAQQDPAYNTPAYQVFRAAAEKGKVPPTIAQWGGVENVMKTSLEWVWEDVQASTGKPIDEATVKARLDAGAQSVNELVATP